MVERLASGSSPADLPLLIAISQNYDDFPANFTAPAVLNPNYVAPFNGQATVGTAIAFSIIAVIVVGARLWVRAIYRRASWGMDDTLIIPGTVFTIALYIVDAYAVLHWGLGYHIYDLPMEHVIECYRLLFVHTMLYLWSTMFTRISLCVFYLRILPKTMARLSLFVKFFIGLLVVYTIAALLIVVFGAVPIQSEWDVTKFVEPVHGWRIWGRLLFGSLGYVLLDIAILVIPILTVWDLHITLRRKLHYGALFCFGGIACVLATARAAIIPGAYNSYDVLWKSGPIATLTQWECIIGIVAACLPILYSPVCALFDRTWAQWSSRSKDMTPYKRPARYSPGSEKSYGWTDLKTQTYDTRANTETGYLDTGTTFSKPPKAYGMHNVLNFTNVSTGDQSFDYRTERITSPTFSAVSLELPIQLPESDVGFIRNELGKRV